MIVTLLLDEASQAHFDALRRAYFPPERLVVGAHVTLFHAVPADEEAALTALLATAARSTAPLPIVVSGVRFLGRGVAFSLECAALITLRAQLRMALHERLTPQDRQRWAPHITVQNKVAPEAARALFTQLSAGFEPSTVTGIGLGLWRYRGGPWEAVSAHRFAG
jgi:2'-5' RNA ligase